MLKNMFCCPAKQFIIFFIGILIFNNQAVKPVDVSSIKDTYSILSDEFKHCSPIHGAVWAETQLLKKYYKQMKPKPEVSDATISLTHELFNLVGDTFSITKAPHNAATYFTAEIIGKIIGIIEINKETLPNELNNFKKQLPQKSKKYANQLFRLISNSLCECGFINNPKIHVSYPPYTTHTILLGFLYKKAGSKEDFHTYFENLKKTITSKSIFTDEGKKLFENTANWNSSYFDKTEVDSIIDICAKKSSDTPSKTIEQFLSEVKQALLIKNIKEDPFETVVFAEIIKQFYQQSLPKVIADSSIDNTYFGDIPHGFGDCTETTIRNLCNFILYNQDEGKFTPVQTENLNPSQELLKFYTGENADATKHTNPDKHETWSNLMQNIPGVIYAQIISKNDPDEHYETDHTILSEYGRPCYVLMTQEELEKINQSKKSVPEKNQTNSKLGSSNGDKIYSEKFVKNTRKIRVGTEEDYIVADPNQYIAYALWPSLKNIIILLNRLFGLELYKDPLAPFKDEKFCSKYFPILCEKFRWTYSGPSVPHGTRQVTLDTPYFYWNEYKYGSDMSGNNIHVNLTNNPKAEWIINICRSHTEIQKDKGSDDGSVKDKISGEYRPRLFNAFLKSKESIIPYDLLALYAPKTIDLKNLFKSETISDIRKKYLRILTGSPDTDNSAEGEDENSLKLKLQKLKDSLSALKNNLELLKTKLETLKLGIKN